jgi:DNA polymerase-3 subunit epsilon/ATP-dependent DNA helicase DinG
VVVAVDVETTGLDPRADRIIEVGAVKFRGDQTIDEFSSLANPHARLDPFITALTGIKQAEVDAAPDFSSFAPALRDFIGGHSVVGHNITFDASFLRSHGVPVNSGVYDTRDLAFVLIAGDAEYSLERLVERFGLTNDRPHRALADARATRALFVELRGRLDGLSPVLLDRIQQLSADQAWPVGALARKSLALSRSWRQSGAVSATGIDAQDVGRRTRAAWGARPARGADSGSPIASAIETAFDAAGPLSASMPGYEPRPQQAAMAAAVAAAVSAGEHAVIEAGTGVGKTLAYLLPAALYATSGGGPVIISTNTINLQEQLLGKDLPAAKAALQALGAKVTDLRAAQLKGRANYICFKKWAHTMQTGAATDQDARVAAKCLLWLQTTSTGDRSELSLGREGASFTRISAQGAAGCPSAEGPCFLRKARAEAQNADVVIINHSLLLSDVAMGGGILPEHDALIIDEAHHLEAVATRHLGFEVTEAQIGGAITALTSDRGLIGELAAQCRALERDQALVQAPAAQQQALTSATRASERTAALFGALRNFAVSHAQPGEEGADIRLTPGVRAQPDWSGVETAWQDFDAPLSELLGAVRAMATRIESASPLPEEAQAVLLNAASVVETLTQARSGLKQAVPEPSKEMVYWLAGGDRTSSPGGRGWLSVNGAPLQVGPVLSERLFKRERAVVMAGATLSNEGSFTRLRAAVGIEPARELVLGSPFDFRSAALIAVPEDMPEPGGQGYAKAVAAAIAEIAVALRDRTLVLFTSNSALEAARKAVAPVLQREGIRVVAQGADGSPHRVMRTLAANKECVAMGAASLWEGVDLGRDLSRGNGEDANGTNASIRALIMPRLPFPVPSDPIFAARSELYEDGFNEFAVPEAVLRFRQGFGRLIRTKSDHGAFVVLDRRILSRSYGATFQRALPKCTVRRTSLKELAALVAGWNRGEVV